MIWPSLNTEPYAGMAPTLPFLIRSTMYSSLRSDFDSFGPLPAWRPPSWWQKPQVVANIFPPSMSAGEASACGSGFEAPTEFDCWANEAVDRNGHMMARQAKITNGIRIPASVITAKAATLLAHGRQGEIDPRRPRHLHCLSAKTTSAPVFFGMLLKGSP